MGKEKIERRKKECESNTKKEKKRKNHF